MFLVSHGVPCFVNVASATMEQANTIDSKHKTWQICFEAEPPSRSELVYGKPSFPADVRQQDTIRPRIRVLRTPRLFEAQQKCKLEVCIV